MNISTNLRMDLLDEFLEDISDAVPMKIYGGITASVEASYKTGEIHKEDLRDMLKGVIVEISKNTWNFWILDKFGNKKYRKKYYINGWRNCLRNIQMNS